MTVTYEFTTCTTCGNDRGCMVGKIRDNKGRILPGVFTICEPCLMSGEYEVKWV